MVTGSGFARAEARPGPPVMSVGVMARMLAQMAGDRAHLDELLEHLRVRAIALHEGAQS